MPTTILQIPKRELHFLTHANEDWRDSFPFVVAASAVASPDQGASGNGTITGLGVTAATPVTLMRVVVVDIQGGATVFALCDLDGNEIGRGVVGVAFSTLGLSFTLNAGPTPFAVDDGFTITVLPSPLDISGIAFDLMLRKRVNGSARYAATTPLGLTTSGSSPTLVNGGSVGGVGIAASWQAMSMLPPATYDYDLLARADGISRTVFYGTVEHRDGATRVAS